MKRTLLSLVVAASMTTAATAGEMNSDNAWTESAKDAWIDGKAEATLLFNGNLDAFDINTDVNDGTVILTGKVSNSVHKKLAEELIADIDGVVEVDNDLTIVDESELAETSEEWSQDADLDGDGETGELTDAKIATVVKTRLLLDSDISAFDIDIDVEAGTVTLSGEVESDAERQLAVKIAQNASDVKDVEDNLKVVTTTAMN